LIGGKSPEKRGFKTIEPLKTERELSMLKTKSRFERFRALSPEISNHLYSTYFVFGNTNSPRAACILNKSDL